MRQNTSQNTTGEVVETVNAGVAAQTPELAAEMRRADARVRP
ncbi:hypothetical protein FHS07_002121 [Microbacterium proteolyticum]|uniref:Uncharacterized protein n=1 Tax=Microbacterium proteolyticum TaxID=1572644 RepID=A0A7W5GG21_9MICO|nr:hypothetical protein [Microbacterium proteolyticum]MBB3158425.1 hypothetical protein [Microbacterium proteolyticum]